MPYARRTRISRWDIPFLQTTCQQKSTLCGWEEYSINIRQSCIDGGDAEFETPEDRSVERPSYDLDLRSPNPVVVLFGVVVETCALLGCHVAIGKAVEVGADEVCCCHLGSEKELPNAITWLACVKV